MRIRKLSKPRVIVEEGLQENLKPKNNDLLVVNSKKLWFSTTPLGGV